MKTKTKVAIRFLLIILKIILTTSCTDLESIGRFITTGSFDRTDIETTITSGLPEAAAAEVISGDLAGAVNTMVTAPLGECVNFDNQHTIAEQALEGKHDADTEVKEEGDLNSFPIVGDLFENVTGIMPKDCGYQLNRFSRSQVNLMCQAMNEVIEGRQVNCHVSNCATATYLAIIRLAKMRPDWEEKKPMFECSSPFPSPYLYFGQRGVAAFVDEYGIGESATLSASEENLSENFQQGWPQKGDAIKLNRQNHSGHAAIFSHYEAEDGTVYDGINDQQISKVCYWSSNNGTNGAGTQCERVARMREIEVGRIYEES